MWMPCASGAHGNGAKSAGVSAMFEYLLLTPDSLITNSNVLMAFSFAISIIALSFMAGEFMSMPSLKGFAKAELYELGVSAVILVILVALVWPNGPFDLVARGFMVQNATGSAPELCEEWVARYGPLASDQYGWYAPNGSIAFGQANYFLGCRPKLSSLLQSSSSADPTSGVTADVFPGVISSRLMKGYTSLMLTQMFTGFLSGFSSGITLPSFKVLPKDVSFMPFIALGPLNQAHTTIVDLLGTVFAAFAAQNMLLSFIEESALLVFLPFGMVLRAFPFSRKTGSTIIAVVVAAFFIYPISILINQQMWMLIVEPPCPQGYDCRPLASPCTADKDCASFDCRNGQCVVPLTDFTEYKSIYALCKSNLPAGDKAAKIDATLSALADEQDKRTLEMYFSGAPNSIAPTKAEGRLDDGLGSMLSQHAISSAAFTTSLLVPVPGRTTQAVFSEVEVLVMDAGQYALLALLFTVFTVVISLTMLKDIAILIGGEPRVFGLSKLV